MVWRFGKSKKSYIKVFLIHLIWDSHNQPKINLFIK